MILPSVNFAGSWKRALIHLRLAFSLILTPLFIFGIYLAPAGPLPWQRIIIAYLIIHIALYGGMNAFNSYYDRDEGPIGALEDPPPVDRTVLVVAMICKMIALVAGFALDPRFGVLIALAIVLSIVYSHPRWRWKGRPALAAITIFVGQGILGVLWGWVAATENASGVPAALPIWPAGGLETIGILGAALWTTGFYPLTGVYQIDADSRAGVQTLAVKLGAQGSFLFAGSVGLLGGLGIIIVLLQRYEYLAICVIALYVMFRVYTIWQWHRRFISMTPRESQRILMNISYWNGILFSMVFFAITSIRSVALN